MKFRNLILVGFTVGALCLAGCSVVATKPSPSPTVSNSANAKARAQLPEYIRRIGKLIIAVDATYPPNEFKDIGGLPAGWEVELLRAASAELGVEPEFMQVEFTKIIPGISSGIYDVGLASMFDTPERRKQVQMVNYYSAGILWAQRSGQDKVSPDQACGLTVAVQRDTFEETTDLPGRNRDCLAQSKPKINILTYVNQSDATQALELGRVNALVADSPVTLYSVMQSKGKLVVAGKVYSTLKYGLPVRQGSKLSLALNSALQALVDSGKYLHILSSWGVQSGGVSKISINGGN